MDKRLFDHGWMFDARSHLERTTTVRTGHDVYLEHPLQPLRLRLIDTWRAGAGWSAVSALRRLVSPASLVHAADGSARQFIFMAPMVARKIDPWRRHQRGQPGDKILREPAAA